MARVTMQTLIDRLRFMTDAARTDNFNGVTYWTDDQLQEVLDLSRVGVPVRLPLTAGTGKINGSEAWYESYTRFPRHLGYEDDFAVYSDTGTLVDPSYYTVEQFGKQLAVTFDPDNVTEDDYEIELTLYNMNLAAAEVWGRKASQRRSLVDMRSGVHQIMAKQEREFCESREKFFRARTAKVFDLPGSSRFRSAASSRSLRGV